MCSHIKSPGNPQKCMVWSPRLWVKTTSQTGLESSSAPFWCVILGKGLHCHKPQFPHSSNELENNASLIGLWGVCKAVMQSVRHRTWHITTTWSVRPISIIMIFVLSLQLREVKQIAQRHTDPQ